MARTKQTARKSTGNFTPRKQLATFRCEPSYEPSRLGGFVLGFDFSGNTGGESDSSKISEMPIFDYDSLDHQDGYTVKRHTKFARNGLLRREIFLISDAIKVLSKKYKKSKHAILFEDDQGKVHCITEEHKHEREDYSDILNNMLSSGRLYGCDLRGDNEMGQFGLVANKDLKKETPVAVDGGWIVSKKKHNQHIERKLDPMLGLSSNEIPVRLFLEFASKDVKKSYEKAELNISDASFVIDCSTAGTETKHIDDARWLHAGTNIAPKEPNLASHLIVNLTGNELHLLVL